MSSSWFYIRQWSKKREANLNKELSEHDAKYLFKSTLGLNKNMFFALVKKENKWKVVSSKEDIKDWTIISLNNKK